MLNIVIYSSAYCPFCLKAKELLDSKGVTYTEITVDGHPEKREEMIAKSARRTVPQIFINSQHIGGCDDLYALDQQGQLDKLLQG